MDQSTFWGGGRFALQYIYVIRGKKMNELK